MSFRLWLMIGKGQCRRKSIRHACTQPPPTEFLSSVKFYKLKSARKGYSDSIVVHGCLGNFKKNKCYSEQLKYRLPCQTGLVLMSTDKWRIYVALSLVNNF